MRRNHAEKYEAITLAKQRGQTHNTDPWSRRCVYTGKNVVDLLR
jgi:hypothetical protein